MYWIYRTRHLQSGNSLVQAELVHPIAEVLSRERRSRGFRSAVQNEPYQALPHLVYRVERRHPAPDNFAESFGFTLYSKRLVDLMNSFGVRFEAFPVTMVDRSNNVLEDFEYFVFHSLEGVLDAMDEERSGWTGDPDAGVPRLVLDCSKFEHRPIFKCNHLFLQLMRNDLKLEIQNRNITGFGFLAPHLYRSGNYGFPPDYTG